jgi:hypothetical protein
MAPAIVNLLNAIRKPASVRLEVKRGEDVVKKVTPDVWGGLNFNTRDPSTLDFGVTFTCPRFKVEKRFRVHLVPTSGYVAIKGKGDKPLGSDAVVVCTTPPDEPPAPLLPPIIAVLLPPIAPPPPQPPDIVPNPNPQPQAQAQAQGAMAAQEQEEPQLAYAHAQRAEERAAAAKAEEKYAMSSYEEKDRGVPPEAVWMMGAVSMSLMYGCAQLARERVRVRTEQVRR